MEWEIFLNEAFYCHIGLMKVYDATSSPVSHYKSLVWVLFLFTFSSLYMPIITHGTVQLFLLCHKFQTFKLLCFVLEIMICSQYVHWCCASFNTRKKNNIHRTMSLRNAFTTQEIINHKCSKCTTFDQLFITTVINIDTTRCLGFSSKCSARIHWAHSAPQTP